MTVTEFQARQIETMGIMLAHTLATTREDKLDWKPAVDETSDTRSALDQAAECINVNRRYAAMFRGEAPPASSRELPFADAKQAQQMVRDSAKELGEAIRSAGDESLGRTIETPMGPMPGAMIMSIALGNLSYHFGQVNYIQRLYGDIEFRVPDEVFRG